MATMTPMEKLAYMRQLAKEFGSLIADRIVKRKASAVEKSAAKRYAAAGSDVDAASVPAFVPIANTQSSEISVPNTQNVEMRLWGGIPLVDETQELDIGYDAESDAEEQQIFDADSDATIE